VLLHVDLDVRRDRQQGMGGKISGTAHASFGSRGPFGAKGGDFSGQG
jgi:hypothetical protein